MFECSRCNFGPGETQMPFQSALQSQGYRGMQMEIAREWKYTIACDFFNKFIEQIFCEAHQRLILKPPVPEPGGSWPSSGRRGLSSEPETSWHGST